MEEKIEFQINKYITLKLEDNKSKIYINGELFRQCKHLLLINPQKELSQMEINSIDEAASLLYNGLEQIKPIDLGISPKEEFWAHCSNIQTWYENDYDTCIIHSSLAFPLLKNLVEAGDTKAIKVFKEEIGKRLNSNYAPVKEFLINENYLDFLNSNELSVALENIGDVLYLDGLDKFPNYIFEATKIKKLIIRESKLTDIPERIKKLKELKSLHLIKCKIKNLPETLNDLESLEDLALSHNEIKSIPSSLGKINNLRKLILTRNFLSDLPDTFNRLRMLNWLDISQNNFSIFPETIFKIKSLNHLMVNNNNIKKIQKSISNLKNLRTLDLNMNHLGVIPDVIGDLQLLESLYIGYNELKSIPESICDMKYLKNLTIAGNKFKEIPKYIFELPMLSQLTIDDAKKEKNYDLLKKEKRKKNFAVKIILL